MSLYKTSSDRTLTTLRAVEQFGSISYKLIGLNFAYTNFPLNKIIKIKTILLHFEIYTQDKLLTLGYAYYSTIKYRNI